MPLKHKSQPDTEQYFLAVSFRVQCRYLKHLKNTSVKKILKDAGNSSFGSNNFYCFQLFCYPFFPFPSYLIMLRGYSPFPERHFFFPHKKAAVVLFCTSQPSLTNLSDILQHLQGKGSSTISCTLHTFPSTMISFLMNTKLPFLKANTGKKWHMGAV